MNALFNEILHDLMIKISKDYKKDVRLIIHKLSKEKIPLDDSYLIIKSDDFRDYLGIIRSEDIVNKEKYTYDVGT